MSDSDFRDSGSDFNQLPPVPGALPSDSAEESIEGQPRSLNVETGAREPEKRRMELEPLGAPRESLEGEARDGADAGRLLDSLVTSIDSTLPHAGESHSEGQTRKEVSKQAGVRHIVFGVGGVLFASPVGEIVEILSPPPLTLMPNVPEWIAGVANLRGEVFAAIDWGRFVGLESTDQAPNRRMLILRNSDGSLAVGLLVNSVQGAVAISDHERGAPRSSLGEQIAELVSGVVQHEARPLLLLESKKFFNSSKILRLQKA